MKKLKLFLILGVVAMVLSIGSNAFAKKIRWKMVTTWPESINLWYGEKEMIKYVKEMTGGNFVIKWFPAPALMKSFEIFDACGKGCGGNGRRLAELLGQQGSRL